MHTILERQAVPVEPAAPLESLWASDVFGLETMRSALPKDVFKSIQRSMRLGGKLDLGVADMVARR